MRGGGHPYAFDLLPVSVLSCGTTDCGSDKGTPLWRSCSEFSSAQSLASFGRRCSLEPPFGLDTWGYEGLGLGLNPAWGVGYGGTTPPSGGRTPTRVGEGTPTCSGVPGVGVVSPFRSAGMRDAPGGGVTLPAGGLALADIGREPGVTAVEVGGLGQAPGVSK